MDVCLLTLLRYDVFYSKATAPTKAAAKPNIDFELKLTALLAGVMGGLVEVGAGVGVARTFEGPPVPTAPVPTAIALVNVEVVPTAVVPTTRSPPEGPPSGAVAVVEFAARRMNASRVLPTDGALIEPTIPDLQWSPWEQKNQMGVESSSTVMVNVVPEGESAVGTKPEKKPPLERGLQGSLNDD